MRARVRTASSAVSWMITMVFSGLPGGLAECLGCSILRASLVPFRQFRLSLEPVLDIGSIAAAMIQIDEVGSTGDLIPRLADKHLGVVNSRQYNGGMGIGWPSFRG